MGLFHVEQLEASRGRGPVSSRCATGLLVCSTESKVHYGIQRRSGWFVRPLLVSKSQ